MEGCTKMCYDRSIKIKTNQIKTSCYWPLVLCKFNICHVYLFILVVISQAVASNDEYGGPTSPSTCLTQDLFHPADSGIEGFL